MTNKQFIAKLKKARQLIKGGWCQGRMVVYLDNGKRQYCLLGALEEAGFKLWGVRNFKFTGSRWSDPASWNDARGRTKAQVLACLDNSIAAAQKNA